MIGNEEEDFSEVRKWMSDKLEKNEYKRRLNDFTEGKSPAYDEIYIEVANYVMDELKYKPKTFANTARSHLLSILYINIDNYGLNIIKSGITYKDSEDKYYPTISKTIHSYVTHACIKGNSELLKTIYELGVNLKKVADIVGFDFIGDKAKYLVSTTIAGITDKIACDPNIRFIVIQSLTRSIYSTFAGKNLLEKYYKDNGRYIDWLKDILNRYARTLNPNDFNRAAFWKAIKFDYKDLPFKDFWLEARKKCAPNLRVTLDNLHGNPDYVKFYTCLSYLAVYGIILEESVLKPSEGTMVLPLKKLALQSVLQITIREGNIKIKDAIQKTIFNKKGEYSDALSEDLKEVIRHCIPRFWVPKVLKEKLILTSKEIEAIVK